MFTSYSRPGTGCGPIGFTKFLLSTAVLLGAVAVALAPTKAEACACGCGVFEVGTSSMLPSGAGGTVFMEFDFQNQTRNWSGGGAASGANNADKQIRTHFFTAGLQYMFDRSWGLQIEVPVWDRLFATDTNFPNSPASVQSTRWTGLGDIRIKGIYTGFSDDMSTGITYGLKLPTGSYATNTALVDSDTQIGTGSTDVLLGGFHRLSLTQDNSWSGFLQAQASVPVLVQNQYRPGAELDTAVGVIYGGWSLGSVQISPILQGIVSVRGRDSGANAASPVASGYERLLGSIGVDVSFNQFMFYADVEVPVVQHFNGNQLTAPYAVKAIVAYSF